MTRWSLHHTATSSAQATATQAAAGANMKNVLDCISFHTSNHSATFPFQVVVRDGASGSGPILWALSVYGFVVFQQSGLNIEGSPNTAMTVEFNATGSGGAGIQDINASGHIGC